MCTLTATLSCSLRLCDFLVFVRDDTIILKGFHERCITAKDHYDLPVFQRTQAEITSSPSVHNNLPTCYINCFSY